MAAIDASCADAFVAPFSAGRGWRTPRSSPWPT